MRNHRHLSGAALRLRPLAAALALIPSIALAQGIATDAQLQAISVTETRSQLDPNLPNSTASKTARELEEQNVFNPEDAAALLPSTTIRKRYLGDRNANVGGRSFGTLQPGRALVYLDGYLISNFLGRFDAPRWNMINVEAIERVDALYGPFSAIYPGNSIGTTMVVTERKPKGLELSAGIKYNRQSFDEYGTDESFGSKQLSARIASRLDSGLWYALGVQHQDSQGHPMGYANAVRGVTAGGFKPVAGTRVSGIQYDRDPQGRDRAIFGATGIDHSVQDTVNLRLGYDISATQEIEGRVSFWRSDSTVRTMTYLRDATGKPVWSGVVNDGTNSFTLPANAFAPSQRDELHRQLGATWKTRNATGWNASVMLTQYQMLRDADRQASTAPPLAALGGAGTVTRRDGTGWNTLELQSTYTPTAGDWGGGRHALVFGLHRNQYQLDNIVNNASDWRTTETTLNQSYYGTTTITALYGQDAWKLTPDLVLTSGLRFETFEASDGSQYFAGPPVAQVSFPRRTLHATSPKLSLAWSAVDELLLRASYGRGVRFPNVDELFNGTRTGSSITTSDPNLRPEVANALELAVEKFWGEHWLRASYFRDDVKDTILRQTDSTVTPSVTRVSNVDRVLTQGIELVWQARDVGIKGLDIGGSATWTDAVVKANAANPAQVGKQWLRIPKQRYAVQASYRPNAEWLFGAAWRYGGRMYNTELNLDTNPDTYGGTSRLSQIDLKAVWKFARHWEWSLGVNNVTNQKAWQAHSLPQRSVQTELRYSMK
ncbi:TonB-dependent receptor [Comamonas granuli]|uniref:TonB-dependent receptor n=1 Tax=Comamonas granuli TaxID=290309 RepID=UPI000A052906|nr:TonB-dependent receptor [Comamonas granuli]